MKERKKNAPILYDHQKQALKFIEPLDSWALFMEQGTGKSKVAIEKIWSLWSTERISCAIIICPNAITEQWSEEQFDLHYPSYDYVPLIWGKGGEKKFIYNFNKRLQDPSKLFLFVVNVEAFQATRIRMYIELLLREKEVICIIDESTRIKNGRRKPVRGKRGGAQRTNLILDLFENVRYKGILTGTPTPNSPFDLWSQFEFLKKDYFEMDYFYFTHHHGIMMSKSVNNRKYTTVLDEKTFKIVKNKISKLPKITPSAMEEISIRTGLKLKDVILIKTMDKFAGYKNLRELKEKIYETTFSVKKKDCLDLPDKVYEKLYCDLNADQKKMYKNLMNEFQAFYKEEELTVTNKLVMYLRLQMITGGLFPYSETKIISSIDGDEVWDQEFKYKYIDSSPKIKTLLEDLQEVPPETKIIIWARFKGEIDLIYDELQKAKYTCEKYYGNSSNDVIRDFKAGLFRILVSSPKGGEGLNLTIATHQYFYSNSYRADMRLQEEDRSHRVGQTNKVTYKDILCRNTVDLKIYDVLKRKENLIDYFRTKERLFL